MLLLLLLWKQSFLIGCCSVRFDRRSSLSSSFHRLLSSLQHTAANHITQSLNLITLTTYLRQRNFCLELFVHIGQYKRTREKQLLEGGTNLVQEEWHCCLYLDRLLHTCRLRTSLIEEITQTEQGSKRLKLNGNISKMFDMYA